MASCGLCNLTPRHSLFWSLFNGPWGAGTQAHSGQQKVKVAWPPTSPGHSASQGQARRAECASWVADWAFT